MKLWTPKQVASLNGYQAAGIMHPFTCGNCRGDLMAIQEGWICPDPNCDYTQNWAHDFMMNDSWRDSYKAMFGKEFDETMINNSIRLIKPYYSEGIWAFDDDAVGLKREAFVAGTPEILEYVLATQNVKNPKDGFLLLFSDQEFPQYHLKAEWLRSEMNGNWYVVEINGERREGWLCPALFKYFEETPKNIYIQVRSKEA